MKVLQLNTHMNVGGVPNYIYTLSKALRPLGVESVIASSGGDLVTELERARITHFRIDLKTKSELSPKVLVSAFAVGKLVRAEGVDVIHAHTRVAQVVALIVSKATGVPVVTTCHGYFKTRARKIFDTWGRRVIAISSPVKDHLIKDLGVDESRISLVYSGVDPDRFARDHSADEIRAIKKSYGLLDAPVVGHIGRLSSVKGQKFLVEAMKEVIASRPDAQLFIIGNGPEEEALFHLARSLGINKSCRFIDSDLDTHKLLSAMEVFVFPSIKEGLGIALLEALSAGRACVASDIGGISDIIESGRNGILTDVGDVKAISAAILKLISDEKLRKELGGNGRQTVKDRFSLDGWARGVRKVYEDVVKK